MDWTSQAILNSTASSKCYLGWYNDSSAACDEVKQGQLPCVCSHNWTPYVIENFEWQNTTYRYMAMTSTRSLNCLSTSTQMLLQTFYWCKFSRKRVLIFAQISRSQHITGISRFRLEAQSVSLARNLGSHADNARSLRSRLYTYAARQRQ